ncbi:MAG: hypothetical protein EOS70_31705 [Mesorhizobium sp.]|uniref:hypothetical protein n=1 Tax=Mesorhizobium sp. TaxID=1871066 RepID=UPI000FE6BE83|nr:hypothetical protein [Mesorhizobium sp.]RWC26433.1 MAG: hypothetical protein EOS70_31705 [Mesorhizobium sp.]
MNKIDPTGVLVDVIAVDTAIVASVGYEALPFGELCQTEHDLQVQVDEGFSPGLSNVFVISGLDSILLSPFSSLGLAPDYVQDA